MQRVLIEGVLEVSDDRDIEIIIWAVKEFFSTNFKGIVGDADKIHAERQAELTAKFEEFSKKLGNIFMGVNDEGFTKL